MSEANKFRETHTIRGRIDQLSPEQFVALINGVCQILEERESSFHGNINAANISFDEEGNVALGEPLGKEKIRYTADQIEYVAPEVFWNDERSEQADVYSLGMLMYTWANAGCLPFLYPDATATDRAEALRRRMSGESFEKTTVSGKLNKIIKKAAAFKAADRYATIAQLQEAFAAFAAEVEANSAAMGEKLAAVKAKKQQEANMMANILAAAEAATATTDPNAPKVTKKERKKAEPVKTEDKKKLSLRPLVVVLLIAAILMVAAVAMQFGAENTTLSGNPSATPVIPTGDPNATPDITPFVDTSPDVSADPMVTDNPLVAVTPTPTPAPIVTIDTSRYNVMKMNVSWSLAAEACMNSGGTLVTINDQNEFTGVCALADKYGLEMVWVGGFRKSGDIVWLSGQTSEYMPWANGEPSYRNTAGQQENFLLLVKTNGVWAYQDMIDDPAAAYPDVYSGKIGYIMEK